jgi:hypothetical protein
LLKAGARKAGEIHLALSHFFSVTFKAATQIPIIGGLACYLLSAALWIIVLSRVDVSIACPMLSSGYLKPAFAPGICSGRRCRYSVCLPFSSFS